MKGLARYTVDQLRQLRAAREEKLEPVRARLASGASPKVKPSFETIVQSLESEIAKIDAEIASRD